MSSTPTASRSRSTAAAARVVGSSRDPLTGLAQVHLDRLAADGRLPRKAAESLLGELVAAFARHHATPTLSDYETVLAESEEMAWIATEGTTWHHAAVRADVDEAHPPALVERLLQGGRAGDGDPGGARIRRSSWSGGVRLRIDGVVEDEEGQAEDPERVVGPQLALG